MARIVDDNIFGPGYMLGQEKYPYDEWADGKTRVLTRGEDFDIETLSFRNLVRVALKKRGYRVRTKVLNEDEVAVQVTGRK